MGPSQQTNDTRCKLSNHFFSRVRLRENILVLELWRSHGFRQILALMSEHELPRIRHPASYRHQCNHKPPRMRSITRSAPNGFCPLSHYSHHSNQLELRTNDNSNRSGRLTASAPLTTSTPATASTLSMDTQDGTRSTRSRSALSALVPTMLSS